MKAINLKPANIAIIFLFLFLSASNIAFAGKIWDDYSLSAKNLAGDILNKLSPGSGYGNYLKSTNFGIGPRIGSLIDNSFGTLRGSANYITNGINSRLSDLNFSLRNSYTGLSGLAGISNLRQKLPSLTSASLNLPSLSNTLKSSYTSLSNLASSSNLKQKSANLPSVSFSLSSINYALRDSANFVGNSINSRLSDLNISLKSGIKSAGLDSLSGTRQKLADLTSAASFSNAFKKVGTYLDLNMARAAGNFKANLQSLNNALSQRNSPISSQNQEKNGFKNFALSGINPYKYINYNSVAKIPNLRNTQY